MSSTSSYVPADDPRVRHAVDLLTVAVFKAWQEGFTATRPEPRPEVRRSALDAQTEAQLAIYELAYTLVHQGAQVPA